MLKIRLTRTGKRNQPYFRIVVAEASRPIKGRFIEILGHLNPRTKEIKLKKDRIKHWLSKGAQPSPTVHNKLVDAKIIIDKKKKATRIKKKVEKKVDKKEQEKQE